MAEPLGFFQKLKQVPICKDNRFSKVRTSFVLISPTLVRFEELYWLSHTEVS